MPSTTDSGSRTSSARCVILWSTLILWRCLCSIHSFGLTPCHIWPHCDTQHPSWNPKSMLVPPLGSHRHHELSQCHHHWDVSLWKKKPERCARLDAQSPMVAIEAPNTQSWLAKLTRNKNILDTQSLWHAQDLLSMIYSTTSGRVTIPRNKRWWTWRTTKCKSFQRWASLNTRCLKHAPDDRH